MGSQRRLSETAQRPNFVEMGEFGDQVPVASGRSTPECFACRFCRYCRDEDMQLVEQFAYGGISPWVFTWSNPAMRCVYVCGVFTASLNHFQSHRRNYFGMLCTEDYFSMVIISLSCCAQRSRLRNNSGFQIQALCICISDRVG